MESDLFNKNNLMYFLNLVKVQWWYSCGMLFWKPVGWSYFFK